MTEKEWYSTLEKRHGADLQWKFSSACVAVCGLGGLGSNVAVSLARSGVGTLLLGELEKYIRESILSEWDGTGMFKMF